MWRDSLKKHLRIECGKDPTFECPICGRKFKHKHRWQSHARLIHYINMWPSYEVLGELWNDRYAPAKNDVPDLVSCHVNPKTIAPHVFTFFITVAVAREELFFLFVIIFHKFWNFIIIKKYYSTKCFYCKVYTDGGPRTSHNTLITYSRIKVKNLYTPISKIIIVFDLYLSKLASDIAVCTLYVYNL